jgi:hypothetical protein
MAPLLNRYGRAVHAASTADPRVYRGFLDVMNLTRPAASLLRPGIALRVARNALRRGPRAAAPG